MRILALFALSLTLFACDPTEGNDELVETGDTDDDVDPCEGVTPAVTDISPDELRAMLDDKDFELINTHIPYAGEIEGTDDNISYQDVDAIEAHLDGDTGTKAVLYCLTGPMSKIAADELVERGYCNIYDMPAGMATWDSLGYPMAEE